MCFSFFSFSQETKITTILDTINIGLYYDYNDTLIVDTNYYIKNSYLTKNFWQVYDSHDNLILEYYFKDDSVYNIQYFKNSKIKKKEVLIDGNLVFMEKRCYNGQLIVRIHYDVNPIHNLSYYCNGNKWEEFYLNGIFIDGLYKTWHNNGNLKEIGNYDNGNKTGKWKYYNCEGELI